MSATPKTLQSIGRKYLKDGYNVTCSKCGKSFSSAADFHTHTQVGYPCGPVAR